MHSAPEIEKEIEKVSHTKSTKQVEDDIINYSNDNIKDELMTITENIKKKYESGKTSHEVPKEDKVLDFLSSAGKVSAFLFLTESTDLGHHALGDATADLSGRLEQATAGADRASWEHLLQLPTRLDHVQRCVDILRVQDQKHRPGHRDGHS